MKTFPVQATGQRAQSSPAARRMAAPEIFMKKLIILLLLSIMFVTLFITGLKLRLQHHYQSHGWDISKLE